MSMTRPRARPRQRGMSLVELMVGIVVGLFVVAAATVLVTGQLGDNRRLLLEAQLQQDLRAAADIMTRELRRTGFWNGAETAVSVPDGAGALDNTYDNLTANSPVVHYTYNRQSGAASFGFRLQSNVLQSCQDSNNLTQCSNWQDLTDTNTLKVDDLDISATHAGAASNGNPQVLACPRTCDSTGSIACWPRFTVRELTLRLTGHAATDTTLVRTLTTTVRLRNDLIRFDASLPAGQVCPS